MENRLDMGGSGSLSFYESIYRFLSSRRGLCYLFAVLLATSGVVISLGSKLETDILNLIDVSTGSTELNEIIGKSPLFNAFYVIVKGEGDKVEFAEKLLGFAKRSHFVSSAAEDGGVDLKTETARFVFNKRFFLLRMDKEQERSFFNEKNLLRKLNISRMHLLSLQAPAIERKVASDPFGFVDEIERNMELASGGMGVVKFAGGSMAVLAEQGGEVVCSFLPVFPPSDFKNSTTMIKKLDRFVERLTSDRRFAKINVEFMGPHLFTSIDYSAIKMDVAIAFAISSILIILLFVFFVRKIAPLLVAFFVMAISVLWGISFVTVIVGKVHGVVLGFSSVLLGISIDYVVHVLASFRGNDGRGVLRIFSSLAASFLTTEAIFISLALSDYPLVKQMGIMAGGGILVAFIVSAFLLPVFRFVVRSSAIEVHHFSVEPFVWMKMTRGRRGWLIVLVSLVLTSAGGYRGFTLQIRNKVEEMDYASRKMKERMEDFQKKVGGMGKGDLLVAVGSSIDEVLERNDEVYVRLKEGLARGYIRSFLSISPLFPSRKFQQQSLEIFSTHLEEMRSAIDIAESKFELEKGFFKPFWDELNNSMEGKEKFIDANDVKGTVVWSIVRNSMFEAGGKHFAISSFIPDESKREKFLRFVSEASNGFFYFNRRIFMNEVFDRITHEVKHALMISIFIVLCVLIVCFRKLKYTLVSIFVVASSFIALLGVISVFKQGVSAITILSLCLILGLGIDYSIFIINALTGRGEFSSVLPAVFLSALTTIFAFSSPGFCRSPVLNEIGRVVSTGIFLNLLFSLIVIPAFLNVLKVTKSKGAGS